MKQGPVRLTPSNNELASHLILRYRRFGLKFLRLTFNSLHIFQPISVKQTGIALNDSKVNLSYIKITSDE